MAERGVVCGFSIRMNKGKETYLLGKSSATRRSIYTSNWILLVISGHSTSMPRLRYQGMAWKKFTVGPIISSLGSNIHSFFIVVYNDASRRPDPSAFSKLELWHSDVGSDFM